MFGEVFKSAEALGVRIEEARADTCDAIGAVEKYHVSLKAA